MSLEIPPNITGKARRLARMKLQSRLNRQQERDSHKATHFTHHTARPKTQKKYVSSENATPSTASLSDAKVARTAYIGLNDKEDRDAQSYALEDLVGENSKFKFELLKYKKGCVLLTSIHII